MKSNGRKKCEAYGSWTPLGVFFYGFVMTWHSVALCVCMVYNSVGRRMSFVGIGVNCM